MTRKIDVVGAKPKKIGIVDRPKPRVEPDELGAALGARPSGPPVSGKLDLIALAELGTQLLQRLRSSGGRPALADATVNCRVPLSAEDVKTLEELVAHISASTAMNPSVGQLASVIVRLHLNALQNAQKPDASRPETEAETAKSLLRQLIDEQLSPLREQVKRLEAELHAVSAGQE